MVEHGDEHGRDTVEAGNPFLVDTCQGVLGREIGKRTERCSVGHGGGHGEDHAETVEHGNLDHHAVRGGKAHPVADTFAVIDDVVMGQHDALGEAGGAGSILHIAHIIRFHAFRHRCQRLIGNGISAAHRLLKGEASALGETDGNDIPEEGQPLAVQRFAGLRYRNLRAELIDNCAVIAVQRTFNHDQRMRIALAKQVIGFMDFIGGIDGYKHGADSGGCPESDIPCGDIRGPYCHLGAGLDSQGNQGFGKTVDIIAEFGIGTDVIQRCVLECVLIRELFRHAVQDLPECQVDQLVLFPDIFAGAVVIEIEGFLFALRIVKTAHIVEEMRKDDFTVRNVFHPFRFPLQGNKSVVVNRRQRVHHVLYGNGAFTDQIVIQVIIRITKVDMVDVSAEVADGGIRRFVEIPVWMVHIPQCAQFVTGIFIHQFPELSGIRENADSLNQHADSLFGELRNQPVNAFPDPFIIVMQGTNDDIRDFHGSSRIDQIGDEAGFILFCAEINAGIQARDRQMVLPQFPQGLIPVELVEDTAPVCQGRTFMKIIDLNSLKTEFGGIFHLLRPGELFPSAG